MKSICRNINHYLLLSQAGLREDMAKRIMYSVIEPITKYPDSTALSLAIEGWKDIVKYGTKAVVGELRHSPREGVYKKASDLYKQDKYLEALDIAIEDYAKPWQSLFGGSAWGKIASQVKEILLTGEKLKKDPSIQNQKDMVIQLNVFDGLAHNTESVMRNLVDIESKEISNPEHDIGTIYNLSYKDISRSKKEYERIRELMDAKELKNFLDVWREIKPEIEGMGSIFFKPYKGRLHDEEISEYKRLTPEQRKQKEENLEHEKALIKFRKEIIVYIKKCETEINKTELNILNLKQSIEELKPLLSELRQKKDSVISDLRSKINNPLERTVYNKIYETQILCDNFGTSVENIEYILNEIKFYRAKYNLPDYLRNLSIAPTIAEMVDDCYKSCNSYIYNLLRSKRYCKVFNSYDFDVDFIIPDSEKIEDFLKDLNETVPFNLEMINNQLHNLQNI